jgi:hypothetical protein
MKTIFKIAALFCLSAVVFASCDRPNELPPKSTAININAAYKMPASTPLTEEERNEINAIRDEFDNSKP